MWQMAAMSNLILSPAGVRAVAMNAGDLSLITTREITQIMGERGGVQLRAVQQGIARMLDDGYISSHEAKELNNVAKLVFATTRPRTDVTSAAFDLRATYEQMVCSGQASAVALAIVSAASASLNPQSLPPPGRMAVAMISPEMTAVGAVIGGVIGGSVGGVIGASAGAGLGATIGAAIGAALFNCPVRSVVVEPG
jgi:hypothetical protein